MLNRLRGALRHPVCAAAFLFAAILTGTGAFGTYAIILPMRLLYWTLITLSAATALAATSRFGLGTSLPSWAKSPLRAVVAAVPASLAAGGAAALLLPAPLSLRRILAFYPAALILSFLLLALFRLTARRETIVEVPAPPTPDDTVPAPIACRLPPRLARSRLVAVEAQDHYLRVATRDGEALIHMRLTDALAALGKSDGARVHRSWWVARPSIEAMKFVNGRGELTLVDGTRVPVSRRFASQAKELARRPKP
jgi:LytTr DNA-binding domain-containing protein